MKRTLILIFIFALLFSANNNVLAKFPDELPGPEVMPDSPFYFLKIWWEKIITFISFGDTKKAERYSKIAERRLYEAEEMAKKGQEKLTKKLLREYEKYFDKTLNKLEEIKQQTKKKIKQEIKKEVEKRIEEIKTRAQQLIDEIFGD